jgi:hypothetical protein
VPKLDISSSIAYPLLDQIKGMGASLSNIFLALFEWLIGEEKLAASNSVI